MLEQMDDACWWGARGRLGTGEVGGSLKRFSDNERSLRVPGTWLLALRPFPYKVYYKNGIGGR